MIRKLLLIVAILAAPVVASAYGRALRTDTFRFVNTSSTNIYNVLEGVALNAAAATRTATLGISEDWAKLRVLVDFTYNAATTVTTVMSCSIDGTTYGTTQSRAISSGTSTLYDMTDTKTTSAANQTYMLEFDVRGCDSIKLLFGGASAGASDLIDIQAVGIVGE